MKVEFGPGFEKIFKNRFSHQKNIQKHFFERTALFAQNQTSSLLRDHALTGKLKGFRAFSITGDIRIIYYFHNDTAYLVDIGTHNQVYK